MNISKLISEGLGGLLAVSFLALIGLLLWRQVSSVKETFENLNPAPLDYGIGNYSNIKLKQMGGNYVLPITQGNKDPLWSYTAQGTPLGLDEQPSYVPHYSNGPSVDGTADKPSQMFMLAYNECKPECCPATFSCDGGCVCTTKNQRDFINQRGNNRTLPTDF